MMTLTKNKIKEIQFDNSKPCALVVNIASLLGEGLLEQFLSQGVNIYGITSFAKGNTQSIVKLKNRGGQNVKLFDSDSIDWGSFNPSKLDYIIILNNNIKEEITSKEFLDESRKIDSLLTLGVYRKSKIIIVNNLNTSDVHLKGGKSRGELYDYIEQLAKEYYHSRHLEVRILNLASVYGPGIENENNELGKLFKKAAFDSKIQQEGDGLTFKYYISLVDAIGVIFKCLFDNSLSGQSVSAAGGAAVSLMSIAYILGALSNKEVIFDKRTDSNQLEDRLKNISNPVNDWKPSKRLEEGLEDVYNQIVGKTPNVQPNIPPQPNGHFFNENMLNNRQNPFIEYPSSTLPTPASPFDIEQSRPESTEVEKKLEGKDVKSSMYLDSYSASANNVSAFGSLYTAAEEPKDNFLNPNNISKIESSAVNEQKAEINNSSSSSSLDELRRKYLGEEKYDEEYKVRKKNRHSLKYLIIVAAIAVVLVLIFVAYYLLHKGDLFAFSSSKNLNNLQSGISAENIKKSDSQALLNNVQFKDGALNIISDVLAPIKKQGILNSRFTTLTLENDLGISSLAYSSSYPEIAKDYASLGEGMGISTLQDSYSKLSTLSSYENLYSKILNISNGDYVLILGKTTNHINVYYVNVDNGKLTFSTINDNYKKAINNDIKGINFNLESMNFYNDLFSQNIKEPDGIFWIKDDGVTENSLKLLSPKALYALSVNLYDNKELEYYIYNPDTLAYFI